MNVEYEELISLIENSSRSFPKAHWLERELFAIRMTETAGKFLEMIKSGKKYKNSGNSVVAYLIGLVDEPPKKSPARIYTGRVEPPDIDTDFEDSRRDEVKEYLKKKWGNVASITTFTKFSGKMLVRDLSRIFGVEFSEVNRVCKQFENVDEFLISGDTKWFRDKYPEIASFVKKFEGRWRGTGVHAAGLVVANEELSNILPLESRSLSLKRGDRLPVTAYDKDDCAEMGLIKLDILGVAILTVVSDCIKIIKKNRGVTIKLNEIPLDDAKVLEEFSAGRTVGVFQAEASSYSKLLRRMGVDSFYDLVVSNALVRPGPLLTVGDSYIKRKRGIETVPVEHQLVEEITSKTYNLFIFQEQLIQALHDIGKFTWTESDKVRKIIGKKRDPEEFKKYESAWMDRASETIGKTKAARLWSDFEKFAGYAFNEAHACAYSLLSYQTMWLKTHYPVEYVFSLLKNEKDQKKVTTYLIEAARLGIDILDPDINKSEIKFSLERGKIRFGLCNIKGVGEVAAEEIINNRPINSFKEFREKIAARRCNEKVVTVLHKIGVFNKFSDFNNEYDNESFYFDLLGYSKNIDRPPALLETEVVRLAEYNESEISVVRAILKTEKKWPQYTKIELEDASGIRAFYFNRQDELEMGKIIIGLVSGSSLLGFTYEQDFIERIRNGYDLLPFEKFLQGELFKDEKKLYQHGIGKIGDEKSLVVPISVRHFKTKKGDSMASMIVADEQKRTKVMVFPKVYRLVGSMLTPWEPVVIKSEPIDGGYALLYNGIIPAKQLMEMKEIK